MKSNYIIFIAIIIIIIIIFICVLNNSASICNERYNNYLTGMWIGDPDFLKQSNLKDLQIFISPKEKKIRQGYIIMTDTNGKFIMNEPIEFKESNNSKKWSALKANKQKNKDKFISYYNVTNTNTNASTSTNINASTSINTNDSTNTNASTNTNEFPKNLKFGLSMCDGTLTIHDADSNKLSALLEKDLISSAFAIEAYNE